MSFTDDDYLPSPKELETEEIPLSWIPFKSAARAMATYCDDANKEYLLCRDKTKDTRKCIEQAKEVTRCGNNFLRMMKKHCNEEFTQYWRCIDQQLDIPCFRFCKREQGRYHKCLESELGVEIPPVGYFSTPRLHTPKCVYPEPQDSLGNLHGEKPIVRADPKRLKQLQEDDVSVRAGAQGIVGAP